VLGEIKINFPDAKLTTLNSVAEGEWVVVRCTYSGTHRGTSRFPIDGGMLVGVQPTGRTFEVQHIHMYRVLDGEIAEHFANRDDVGMMRQLGLLPPPPQLWGSVGWRLSAVRKIDVPDIPILKQAEAEYAKLQ
jgi:SnoaL-like polyketide cyclase